MGTEEAINLKTLGTGLRHAMQPVTQEPLPECWRALVVHIEDAVQGAVPRSGSAQVQHGKASHRGHGHWVHGRWGRV